MSFWLLASGFWLTHQKNSVIPTGAKRSFAQWRDLVLKTALRTRHETQLTHSFCVR
jgi:hypothetical protein